MKAATVKSMIAIPPRNRCAQFFIQGKSIHVFWIQEQLLSQGLDLHIDGKGMSTPRQVIFVQIAAGPEKIIETKEQGKNHNGDSQTHEASKHAQFELIRGVPPQYRNRGETDDHETDDRYRREDGPVMATVTK